MDSKISVSYLHKLAKEDTQYLLDLISSATLNAAYMSHAIDALEDAKPSSTIKYFLLSLLEQGIESPCVRESIVFALTWYLGDNDVSTCLLRAKENDPSPGVKAAIEATLNMIPSPMEEMPQQYFRKKPVTVQAYQWFEVSPYDPDRTRIVDYYRHPHISGQLICSFCRRTLHEHGFIDTPEGGHKVCPGDWVIKGVEGEFYACKDSVFKSTYERVPTWTETHG